MKVLVTGVKGQLGHDVCKELSRRGHLAIGIDREEMDLTKATEIVKYTQTCRPEAIIHCAAYTAVDAAESQKELCYQVNAEATKVLAEQAKELDIPFIYISTDYVFDGTKDSEYTEEDETNPRSVYGASKLLGEQYVQELLEKYYIVRISWVFGENGNNFIRTMLRLGKERDEINVVADQIGSPTYTLDLAPLLVDMLETNKYGIYHATNEGYCSWYEFAKEIFKVAGMGVKVNPITTEQYPTAAERPMNSKLNKNKLEKANFTKLRHWKQATEEYTKDILK